jgi:hypothetical protein
LDFGRQLIRFSLPGGLFGLLAAIYLELFRESWKVFGKPEDAPHPSVLDPVTQNFIATAIGLLIGGFLIYQLYYVFYRPRPRIFGIPLSRPKDRGGRILMPLNGITGLPTWIEEHFDARLPTAILPHSLREPTEAQRSRWYENNALVRALLTYIAEHGGGELKRDIDYRADMYHALGACRLAATAAAPVAIVYVGVADHSSAFGNLVGSACVAILAGLASGGLYWVFRKNRKNAWYALTAQARQGLYSWFTTSEQSPTRITQAEATP